MQCGRGVPLHTQSLSQSVAPAIRPARQKPYAACQRPSGGEGRCAPCADTVTPGGAGSSAMSGSYPVATVAARPASRYPRWRNLRMTRRLIVCTTSTMTALCPGSPTQGRHAAPAGPGAAPSAGVTWTADRPASHYSCPFASRNVRLGRLSGLAHAVAQGPLPLHLCGGAVASGSACHT
jgi:hypothetical protein